MPAAGTGRDRSAPARTRTRRAGRRGDRASPCRFARGRGSRRRARPRAGARPPAASSASRCRTSRASAGGSAERSTPARWRPRRADLGARARATLAGGTSPPAHRRPAPGGAPAELTQPSVSWRTPLAQRGVDGVVEHRGLVAQRRQRRRTLSSAAGCSASSASRITPARRGRVRRVLAPRQAARLAVRRGLRARHAQQRADDPARALGHAQQRATARRGHQPVEDGLGLVGRGVTDRDQRVALGGEPFGLGVAHLARPRLDVAVRRARAVHEQLDAEALADRAAVRLVGVGLGAAQPVVDVQRADDVGHVHVEQAGRVAAAREEHEEPHRGAARNSSVACSKPLSLTSPIGWKLRWRPAASLTSRVTSTSPPVARAPTRAARLTARP